MKHNIELICHWIYLFFVLTGLIWQFVEVSLNYFAYYTETHIKIGYPSKFDFPALTLCIRYTDIIDYNEANANGHNWNNLNDVNIQKIQGEITIKEIFELTPINTQINSDGRFNHQQIRLR